MIIIGTVPEKSQIRPCYQERIKKISSFVCSNRLAGRTTKASRDGAGTRRSRRSLSFVFNAIIIAFRRRKIKGQREKRLKFLK